MKSLDELRGSNLNCERLLYYYITENWQNAENDHHWEVRTQAYTHTGNWKKALDDKEDCIRALAQQILNYKLLIESNEPTKSI